MLKEIVTYAGLLLTTLSIVKIVIELARNPIWKVLKKNIIVVLMSVIILLVGLLLIPKCDNPSILIKTYSNTQSNNHKYEIDGKAKCFLKNQKIALLIHRLPGGNSIERWFIHYECASLDTKSKWHFDNVEVGTPTTKDVEYEIYVYGVSDSICLKNHEIVINPIYSGTPDRPVGIEGVYDKIIISR